MRLSVAGNTECVCFYCFAVHYMIDWSIRLKLYNVAAWQQFKMFKCKARPTTKITNYVAT